MAVRIRVYPQNGMGAMGAMGGMYGNPYATQAQVSNVKLQNERKTGNMRIAYERALADERVKLAQLSGVLSAGVPAAQPFGAYGMSPFGVGAGMLGGAAYGAVPPGFGVVPGMASPYGGMGMMSMGAGLPLGAGQSNVTTQNATGTANQSVSNANTYNSYSMGTLGMPYAGGGFPFGWGGHGGGGFLSSLLGALI